MPPRDDITTGGSGRNGRWVRKDYIEECARRNIPDCYKLETIAEIKRKLGLEATHISKEMDKAMKDIYYKDGIVIGRDALFTLVNERLNPKGIKVPRQTVRDWLRKQEVYQLYYQQRGDSKAGHFPLLLPFTNISVDLIDTAQKQMKGNVTHLLVCVDNFSRYVYIETLNNKTSQNVAKKMERILRKIQQDFDRQVKVCFHDQGSEFVGKQFQQLLENEDIESKVSVAQVPSSNGMVERAIGSIKRLYTKRTRVKGGDRADSIPGALKSYNEVLVHKSTGFKPKEAANFKSPDDDDDIAKLRENVKSNLKDQSSSRVVDQNLLVGDKVRKRTNRSSLTKASNITFTEEIYTITEIIPGDANKEPKYKINEDKTPPVKYRSADLQKVYNEEEMYKLSDMKKAYKSTTKVDPALDEDNDSEEVTVRETRSTKPRTKNVTRTYRQNADKAEEFAKREQRVRKQFQTGKFKGTIDRVDYLDENNEPNLHITYDDGDQEHLTYSEFEKELKRGSLELLGPNDT